MNKLFQTAANTISGLFEQPVYNNQESKVIHTCHVCATCQNDDLIKTIADIEDVGTWKTTGVLIFDMICDAVGSSSDWVLIEKKEGLVDGPQQDAQWDTRLPMRIFEFVSDPSIQLRILPVRCLSTCSLPHTVALVGDSSVKYSYQFVNINLENLDDLVAMITQYVSSADGYTSTRTRPRSLKGCVSARIPPITGIRL